MRCAKRDIRVRCGSLSSPTGSFWRGCKSWWKESIRRKVIIGRNRRHQKHHARIQEQGSRGQKATEQENRFCASCAVELAVSRGQPMPGGLVAGTGPEGDAIKVQWFNFG